MVQPIRVLIADDSVRTRAGLRVLFATYPQVLIVGEAADGQAALALAALYRPDVVLLDLHMPLLDGFQVAQSIKRLWPDIAVVVLTVCAAEQSAALAAGADAFVIKGTSPERLLSAIGVLDGVES